MNEIHPHRNNNQKAMSNNNKAWMLLIESFLECSVHQILYARQIYFPALFEQRRYLGITVWQCRHPEVIGYVKRVFDNMRPLLSKVSVHLVFIKNATHYLSIFMLGPCGSSGLCDDGGLQAMGPCHN
jgi:hypothetical protein